MIIPDTFKVHKMMKIRAEFGKFNTAVEFIPAEYTSVLQPCDVGVNRSFKRQMRSEAQKWLLTLGKYLFCDTQKNPLTVWYVYKFLIPKLIKLLSDVTSCFCREKCI